MARFFHHSNGMKKQNGGMRYDTKRDLRHMTVKCKNVKLDPESRKPTIKWHIWDNQGNSNMNWLLDAIKYCGHEWHKVFMVKGHDACYLL